jgi:hypothetical protein
MKDDAAVDAITSGDFDQRPVGQHPSVKRAQCELGVDFSVVRQRHGLAGQPIEGPQPKTQRQK